MKINNILVIIFVLVICLCIYYVYNNSNITNILDITNNLNEIDIKNNFNNTEIYFGVLKFKSFNGRNNMEYGITNGNFNQLHNFKKYILGIIVRESINTENYKFFLNTNSKNNVYLYEDKNFAGEKLELKPGFYNLTKYKLKNKKSSWNDRVSSLSIPPYTRLTLYEHINGLGKYKQHINNTDNYKKINMNKLGLKNDILSSVKIESIFRLEEYHDELFSNFIKKNLKSFIPENLIIYKNYILKLSVIDDENNNETENIYFSGDNYLDYNLANKLIKVGNRINIFSLSTNNSVIKNNSIILHIQKTNDTKSNKKYIFLPKGEYKFNKDQFIKILKKFNIPTSKYSIKKVEIDNNYTNNFEFSINSQIINPNEEI